MKLRTETDRANILHLISNVNLDKPKIVEIKDETRTLEQNALMWAMLRDISKQVKWFDNYYSPEDWKDLISSALRGQRTAPGIEGGIVAFGERTSKMSKERLSELIEYLYYFGAEKEVKWSDPKYQTYEEWSNV